MHSVVPERMVNRATSPSGDCGTNHRRGALGWITATFAGVLLAGCGVFGTPKKPPDPLPAASAAVRVTPLWRVSLGSSSGIGFAPVAIGDAVWAATADGTVLKLTRRSRPIDAPRSRPSKGSAGHAGGP